jgi:hypothetical protein
MRFTQPPSTRIVRVLAILFALAIALRSGIGAEPSKDTLIVPGSNIGKTHLGPDGEKTLKQLPAPTASEGGMSQERLIWLSGKQPQRILFIHTTANGALDAKPPDGVTIDEIRITSPAFHTREGIHCGSTLAQIRAAFPGIRPGASTPDIYEDSAHGIGFEFEDKPGRDSPCIAITIFLPGSPHSTTRQQIDELIKNHP